MASAPLLATNPTAARFPMGILGFIISHHRRLAGTDIETPFMRNVVAAFANSLLSCHLAGFTRPCLSASSINVASAESTYRVLHDIMPCCGVFSQILRSGV